MASLLPISVTIALRQSRRGRNYPVCASTAPPETLSTKPSLARRGTATNAAKTAYTASARPQGTARNICRTATAIAILPPLNPPAQPHRLTRKFMLILQLYQACRTSACRTTCLAMRFGQSQLPFGRR